jgi:toxin ParE1/3/4
VRSFTVKLTAGAHRDLRSIHDYIDENDSRESADYVVRNILRTIESLKEMPTRGVHPAELLAFGNRNYRELFFKPYRILSTVRDSAVYVALIADGRRDMHSLLANRLLRP